MPIAVSNGIATSVVLQPKASALVIAFEKVLQA